MKRKTLILAGVVFILIGAAILIAFGSSFSWKIPVSSADYAAEDYSVTIEQDHEIVRVTGQRLEGQNLYVDLRSVSRGRAYLDVVDPNGKARMEVIYVHLFGIITAGQFLGESTGSKIIPILVIIYLLLVLFSVIRAYRRSTRQTLYRYANVRYLGWIIFLTLMLLLQIPYLFASHSLLSTIGNTLSSASSVAIIVFPIAFIVSIFVAISNIQLLRREGRNWRNLLGIMLGLLVCLSTVLPSLLSDYLQSSTLIDVHNERLIWTYLDSGVTDIVLVSLSYLECILWATVILAGKAAKRIPAFDKDYILILGSQIRKDGTLTPLLQGRADRAVEFARMQKEATGKDIIFVPSGGQGSDEVIAEAQAIKNYLISTGIPEDKILAEDASTNTYENFKNSMALIQKSDASDAKIAFSTTNYHVFRSGILAEQQGILAEGIGSRTRTYFWVNAFVREFIATMYSEWRKHLRVILSLMALTVFLEILVYISNIL